MKSLKRVITDMEKFSVRKCLKFKMLRGKDVTLRFLK